MSKKQDKSGEITQDDIDDNITLFLETQDDNPRYACDIANAIFSYLYELAYSKESPNE